MRIRASLAWRWPPVERKLRLLLNLPIRLPLDDREILEDRIIPYVVRTSRTVLDIGCDFYTNHYPRLFRRTEYWTLDADPSKARFGGTRHITAPLKDALFYLERATFDSVICNGVYGWGLTEKTEVEESLTVCRTLLKPGGLFVFGWNDLASYSPFQPEEFEALERFERFDFPGLDGWRHRCEGDHKHVFDFYRRPEEPDASAPDPLRVSRGSCKERL